MGDKSAIEWTDATWNPIVGCSIVSPGCRECYAMPQAARIQRMAAGAGNSTHYEGTTKSVKGKPVWTGKVNLAPDHIITAPLSWKKPRRIFVNSMGDLFHEDVPDAWIDKVFAVMALCPQHSFQVLTKRSKRMRDYMNYQIRNLIIDDAMDDIKPGRPVDDLFAWPLENVWLGVSCEDQARADERIPDLLATPAAVRFVSAEPLIGPWYPESTRNPTDPDGLINCLYGNTKLDWIIAGGESGPAARPMHPDWVRSIRDQCAAAGTAFFFKQWGAWLPGQNEKYRGSIDLGAYVAHHQDGSWGPQTPKNVDENYVMWDRGGRLFRGDWSENGRPEISAWAQRLGKKRAGRLLDGIEHNGYPI